MNQPGTGKPATSAQPDSAELSWSELADALWLASYVKLPDAPGAQPPPATDPAARRPGRDRGPEQPVPRREPPADRQDDAASARGFAPEWGSAADAGDGV